MNGKRSKSRVEPWKIAAFQQQAEKGRLRKAQKTEWRHKWKITKELGGVDLREFQKIGYGQQNQIQWKINVRLNKCKK